MRPAVVLAICALSALLPPARGSEPLAAAVAAVDVAAARDLVRSGGYSYLDVRTEEEFRKGHVEDSLNVPYLFFTSSGTEKNPKFIEQVKTHFDKQDSIVVGCKSGVRSQLACADLMATPGELAIAASLEQGEDLHVYKQPRNDASLTCICRGYATKLPDELMKKRHKR